jgi:CBS domain-containing protein
MSGENFPVQDIHTREDTKMNILFFLKPKAEVAFVYDYHTLRQAMEIMEYHKYSSIPMINREGKYVGTITEGDLLWGLKKLNILNLKGAEDIAITKIARRADYRPVSADSNMEDLMEKAMDQNFVPVIDDQKNFIGIITRKDIIGYCYEKIKKIAN